MENNKKNNINSIICNSGKTYKYNKLIDEGGFSLVFKVIDGNNDYIVKKIYGYDKQYNNEMMILNKVSEIKGFVKMIDYKDDTDEKYIIMENCGKNLFDIINKTKINDEMILKIFKSIVNSFYLFYTKHNAILYHRDLKLENILIKDNDITVCDFGFSGISNQYISYYGRSYGTITYKAPELIYDNEYNKDNKIDYEKSDIWSLGICIFTLITRKYFPWMESMNINSIKNIIIKMYDSGVITNSGINLKRYLISSTISKNILELLSKMMSYDPSQRPTWIEIYDKLNIKS